MKTIILAAATYFSMWTLQGGEQGMFLYSLPYGNEHNPVVSFSCAPDGSVIIYGPLEKRPRPNADYSVTCGPAEMRLYPSDISYSSGMVVMKSPQTQRLLKMMTSFGGLCQIDVDQVSTPLSTDGLVKGAPAFTSACAEHGWNF